MKVPHRITYKGSKIIGFSWECSCGSWAGCWGERGPRTAHAREHLNAHIGELV